MDGIIVYFVQVHGLNQSTEHNIFDTEPEYKPQLNRNGTGIQNRNGTYIPVAVLAPQASKLWHAFFMVLVVASFDACCGLWQRTG